MHARTNMTTKKTAKKKITTTSTHLQKTQSVIVREPWAIGKPDEKVNLPLSWRQDRRTRHTMALRCLHRSKIISRLGWGSSNRISLYGASNTGVCSRGRLVSTSVSSNTTNLMNSGLAIKGIMPADMSSMIVINKFPRNAWDYRWEGVTKYKKLDIPGIRRGPACCIMPSRNSPQYPAT